MTDYAFEGPKWATTTITWSFAAVGGNFTDPITGAYQATVRAAIARWAQFANLTFKEVPDSSSVNIRIGWGSFTGGQVGETDFTYVTSAAGVQYFRPGTTIRLEDPSARPIGTGRSDYYQGTATTLYQTVLHEIGHALGLDHSTNSADIMFPSLGPAEPDLGSADVQGIQLLYGAPAGGATLPTVTAVVTPTAPITPTTVNLASGVIAVYRFFDSSTGTQFLTANPAERNSVIATRSDLTYEGIGFGGISSGTDPNAIPVYRFFESTNGTHFFTSSASEKATLAATRPDLVLEQTTFYEHATSQTGDNAVYRFFDKTDGTHFYTASTSERATIIATRSDMAFEGVAFYAPTTT